MATPTTGRRRRSYKTFRLFFSLVLSFFFQYLRARLRGRSYDFFADSEHNRKRAIKIRQAALEMGGVLIKVGQFLSSRVDLLPAEYIEELALLQDEVPGVPFSQIRTVIEQELGGPLDTHFATFDPNALAAASLGQVHRATLPTGELVAVKVQRPNIDRVVEADLESLRYIVGWLDHYTPIRRRVNLPIVLREFEETLTMELHYRLEGHHAERIAISFRDVPEVAIPRIFWSHSTDRVLCLQYMTGVKVTDFEAIHALGINRGRVAEILMAAYLKQILEDGFFHADPHPGNIFVRPGPQVVFLDFGMVGDISTQMRDNIRRVFLGVIRRDFDEVLNALARLGFLAPNADRQLLKRALVWTVDTFYELSFGELRKINPVDVLDELQDVFYSESFQIPANFAFLGRALGTLSGLSTALDPSFQFVTVAEPYARSLLGRDRGLLGVLNQVRQEAQNFATTAYELPYATRDALHRVQSGELDLRRDIEEVVRAVERLERAMRRILYALLLVALPIAASFVHSTHNTTLEIIAFLALVALIFGVLAPYRRRR